MTKSISSIQLSGGGGGGAPTFSKAIISFPKGSESIIHNIKWSKPKLVIKDVEKIAWPMPPSAQG